MKSLPRTILAVLAVGVLTSPLFSRPAQAAPIQGTIDFGGVVTFDTTSLATATRVNIWNSSLVLQRTGDFANPTYSIDPGDPATMAAPWIFNPSTNTPSLWSIGGFTFDLTSSVIFSQSSTFLDVRGVGTATGNGFDPTPGFWTFSSTQSNGSNNPTFSFQSQTVVPEGNTLALFTIGGVCLVCARFLRRKLKPA
jgi:hypothetical protein